MEESVTIRFAEEADAPLILQFIRSLAQFEKLEDQVEATLETLKDGLFDKDGPAQCLLAYADDAPVGFALFFFNFSSFLGRVGLYLEDLFVVPEARSKGVGALLLQTLAKIAVENGCGRMEWAVLDWNQRAIDFYLTLGAGPTDGWQVYRLGEEELKALALG